MVGEADVLEEVSGRSTDKYGTLLFPGVPGSDVMEGMREVRMTSGVFHSPILPKEENVSKVPAGNRGVIDPPNQYKIQ